MTAIHKLDQSALPTATLIARPDEGAARNRTLDTVVQQWFKILTKWRWVIVGSLVVAAVAAIIVTMLMTRMYTATTTLEIAREEANVVNIEGVEPQIGSLDQEFYQTQYGLLRSRTLAEKVAQDLDLHNNRGFFELFGEADAAAPFADTRTGALPREGREERLRLAAEILLDHVAVSPERASRLVTLAVETPDAQLSARIVNSWAQNFIQSNLERRFEATTYARDFLEDRLEQTRQRLEQSERELVNYAASNDIILVSGPSSDAAQRAQERSTVTDNLLSLNEQLSAARGRRIAAESRYREFGSGGASRESLTNPAIASLRERRAEAAAEYARLLAQFQPDYPPVRSIAAQVQNYDQSIAREENRVRNSIVNEYREAVAAEQQLARRVETLENQVIDQRRRGIQYNIYQREVDTNRELYNALLQRYKEIGVAGGIGTNNIAVVDTALPPEKPSQPRPLINLLIALLAGSAIGVALAFILDQIDEAFSDPAQIERELNLPALGTVPQVTDKDLLEEISDRKSELAEAYLTVETGLKFSTPDGLPRSLLITSTQPGEGKSTSSASLAITLARLGYNTLLVDADMRSPSVHGMMGVSNERGLSDVLSGNATLESALVESERKNLSILPAGHTPPNAAELLSGLHLDEMIRSALDRFDAVLIDAPPVMGLADAPLIASKVAGCVMIVEANRTRARQAALALKRLRSAHANMLGVVLTKFNSRRAHYGYGYDYGYGYGSDDENRAGRASG